MMGLRRVRAGLALIVAGAVCACSAFQTELPRLLYWITLNGPVAVSTCDELAAAMVSQATLTLTSRPLSRDPNMTCYATLRDTSGNGEEVGLHVRGPSMDMVIIRHGALGPKEPNEASLQLADRLIGIIKARYPMAEAKREKVYWNPLGP